MRAVEREPFAQRRSSRHDELCVLAVSSDATACIARLWRCYREREPRLLRVSAEAECGSGFCDVLLELEVDGETHAIVVEVKTDDEAASAGDTIRQLKWYRARLNESGRYKSIKLAVLAESWDESFDALCELEHIGLFSPGGLAKGIEARRAS